VASTSYAREEAGALVIDVLVAPRASRAKLGPVHGDRVKVAVTAPPVDGEANAAVIELFAKRFGVAKRDVTITSGPSSKRKTVRVAGATLDALARALTA
jgi:uncharacterized protein (TIGR00251 family)